MEKLTKIEELFYSRGNNTVEQAHKFAQKYEEINDFSALMTAPELDQLSPEVKQIYLTLVNNLKMCEINDINVLDLPILIRISTLECLIRRLEKDLQEEELVITNEGRYGKQQKNSKKFEQYISAVKLQNSLFVSLKIDRANRLKLMKQTVTAESSSDNEWEW